VLVKLFTLNFTSNSVDKWIDASSQFTFYMVTFFCISL